MEWDLCNNPPCIPFYSYNMFQNTMPKQFCQKLRKTIITQKVLVPQSSDIVHCDQHTQKPMCADFQAFQKHFCYVWQYSLVGYSLTCLGVIILHMIVCTVIHKCSSSGSLFFTSLWQNN